MKFEWDEEKNHTERKDNIRLISARLATKKERSIYYDTDSYIR